ncbi:hypothetical protein PI124_g17317 [Phytophthora idaei]|nr:hypothetical protein PI125_g17842 [Phytophthora idaei]KAG3139184.1 hypothetical protein PI126_g16565 [Phytophthora idaei]KAG3237705.1 hypothetical protein PI124_g17317 [Phytophthora idaei]
MGVEKVQKTAIVRKHVRESERSTKRAVSTTTSTSKRPARPDERPSVRDYRFEQPTEESDDESDDDASDAAFEYWREVLSELNDDEDTQSISGDAENHAGVAGSEGSVCQSDHGGVGEENDVRRSVDPEHQVNVAEHRDDNLQGSVDEDDGQAGEVEDDERKRFEKMGRKIARYAKEEIP